MTIEPKSKLFIKAPLIPMKLVGDDWLGIVGGFCLLIGVSILGFCSGASSTVLSLLSALGVLFICRGTTDAKIRALREELTKLQETGRS